MHRSSLRNMPALSDLATIDIYDPITKIPDVAEWLNAEAHGVSHRSDDHGYAHRHHHDINRHNAEIGSFVLQFERALHWGHIANWLEALGPCHCQDLLALQGILDIRGPGPPIRWSSVQGP